LYSNRVLVNFVFYIIFIKILLHYTLPAILRIYRDFQFEKTDDVKFIDILIIYLIEFFSWLFWLLGFFIASLIYKRNQLKIEKTEFVNMNIKESKFLFFYNFNWVCNKYVLSSFSKANECFVLDFFTTIFLPGLVWSRPSIRIHGYS